VSFIDWKYPFFLAAVAVLYWQLPLRGRHWLLLVASYAFYASWDPRFGALLLCSTTVDFFCTLALVGERRPLRHVLLASSTPFAWVSLCHLGSMLAPPDQASSLVAPPLAWVATAALPLLFTLAYPILWRLESNRRRLGFLWLSIGTNLGVLAFFKYFNFFANSLSNALSFSGIQAGWTLPTIILPIAISFYTFQSISYAVDVYKGRSNPARSFVLFAAYLAFFPQLISGPIERVGKFLPQFEIARIWRIDHLHIGLRLLLIGCFKKVVVADSCAILPNYAFDPATPLNWSWALLGSIAFAFQIYGDFSGYTDMAIGSARLLGIELSQNFRFPYLARGPSEFWQRWHITLSSWFRDYVYIPLGGNRHGMTRTLLNLWISMLLAGLWHGAAWNFVLWGAWHAAILSLYRLPGLARMESGGTGWTQHFAVPLMWIWTLIGWVLFRSGDLTAIARWFNGISTMDVTGALPSAGAWAWLSIHVLPLFAWQLACRRHGCESGLIHWPWPVRGVAYTLVIAAIASAAAGEQEFIYFQF